jgi:hypothetical protein
MKEEKKVEKKKRANCFKTNSEETETEGVLC